MIGSYADATPSITQYREAWAIRNGCGPLLCHSSVSFNESVVAFQFLITGSIVIVGIDAIISHPHKRSSREWVHRKVSRAFMAIGFGS